MISPSDTTGFVAKHVITLSLSSTEATIVAKALVTLAEERPFSTSLVLVSTDCEDCDESIKFLPFFSRVIIAPGLLALL